MAEMRNLLPDPWPSRLSWEYAGGGNRANLELRMTSDQTSIYMRTLATPPAWIGLWVPGLTPGGEYVAAICKDGSPVTLLAKDEISGPRLAQVECAQGTGCYAIRFTPTGDRALVISIAPPTVNDTTSIKHFTVMSGEDWDTMRNLKNSDGSAANIRWFAPPKTAATGVMSTPALDRGGALLVPLAIIHTLMWRWQHDGDAESEPGPVMPEGGMVEDQLGDSHAMLGQPVEIHEHRHLEELGVRRRTENGRGAVRACPVRNRRDRQQTIKLPDLHHQQRGQCAEGHDLGHPLLDRRNHDPRRGIGSRDTDQLRDPRHEAARLCGLHPGGLGARAGTPHQKRATQTVLPVVGHANVGHAIDATATSAHTLTLASRWEVAA